MEYDFIVKEQIAISETYKTELSVFILIDDEIVGTNILFWLNK